MNMQIVGLGQLFERILNVYESLLDEDVEKAKNALRVELTYILKAIDDIWLDCEDVERVKEFGLSLVEKIKRIVQKDGHFSWLSDGQEFDEYIETLTNKLKNLE
jgi:hypothetical protein